jgi:hypothetical protein
MEHSYREADETTLVVSLIAVEVFYFERETGFEPATFSLEGRRSSQLSYSRECNERRGEKLAKPCLPT